MSVISYNDFFKKKKKKEDEDDIAPTKKSGSVISLEDFAGSNYLAVNLVLWPTLNDVPCIISEEQLVYLKYLNLI